MVLAGCSLYLTFSFEIISDLQKSSKGGEHVLRRSHLFSLRLTVYTTVAHSPRSCVEQNYGLVIMASTGQLFCVSQKPFHVLYTH